VAHTAEPAPVVSKWVVRMAFRRLYATSTCESLPFSWISAVATFHAQHCHCTPSLALRIQWLTATIA